MARINRLFHQIELNKEDYICFVDNYMLLYKSVNMCRNVKSVNELIEICFIPFREKYKKIIGSKVFRDKMGSLYAHAYNTIHKLKK